MSISSIPGISPLLNSLSGTSSTSGTSSSSSSSSSSSTSSTSSSSSSSGTTSSLPALAEFDEEQYKQTQATLTGYTQLQSVLTSFQNSMVSVLAEPFSSALSGVTSSNGSVAYISPSAATNYAVSVSQLAQEQQIQTTYAQNSTFSTAGGTLQVQLGNISNGTFTANGSAVSVNIASGDSLQQVAAAITNANAGVTASVVTDSNGTAQLQVTGGGSGAANGFQINATTTDASGSGLNTLVYTATNTANYTTQKAAQDAQYTVNGQAYSSPTNLAVPVAAGINLNLLTTGSTVVSQPEAPTNIVNSANSLVSTVNGLFSVIQQFTASGGPLAGDPSVVNELQNDVTFTLNSEYGSGTVAQLGEVGIQLQADGTYAVNTQTLSQAFQTDPSGTQNLLSQVAGALLKIVQNYNGQYGTITNQITNLTNQEQNIAQQFQIDSQTASTANTQAQNAVNAYNLLSLSTGGSASPFTSVVS